MQKNLLISTEIITDYTFEHVDEQKSSFSHGLISFIESKVSREDENTGVTLLQKGPGALHLLCVDVFWLF
jgi:hypothetical protein